MPSILDNKEEMSKLDSKQMSESIRHLSGQIRQVAKEAEKVKIPASYKKIKNIVFAGMGGSTLGAHCIRSIYEKELEVPLEIVNNYDLPATVNKNTLVFVSSYSGMTEEVLSAYKKALVKKAKIFIITSGGELAKIVALKKAPGLVFGTENNPCGSPRMGLGYTIFGPLAVLARLKLIKVGKGIFETVAKTAFNYDEIFGQTKPETENLAKQFATEVLKGPVWYIASDHLSGNAHVAANQINENAKRFGGYFIIPELNHHLLEGLSYPKNELGTFIFLESNLYDKRVLKRYSITKEILTENSKQFLTYTPNEKSKLLQAVEVLVFGSYVGYYAAILEGIDPTAIPVVDFLKAALKKL